MLALGVSLEIALIVQRGSRGADIKGAYMEGVS